MLAGKEDEGAREEAKVGVTMNTIFHRAPLFRKKPPGKLSKAQRRRRAVVALVYTCIIREKLGLLARPMDKCFLLSL